MSGAAAARSFFRSTSVRNAAARLSSTAKPSSSSSTSSSFRFTTTKPISNRILRCPVEMSACLETMQPFHTVTASALMTSMLTLSRNGYAWLPQGLDDTS